MHSRPRAYPVHERTAHARRVPDVTCTNPRTGVEYVIDARIFWNSMSEGPAGYTAYTHTGAGAKWGERQKQNSWDAALRRRRDLVAGGVATAPLVAVVVHWVGRAADSCISRENKTQPESRGLMHDSNTELRIN